MLEPTSAVAEDIVLSPKLPSVPCLRCPFPAGASAAFLRLFTSNGPGAIVFILWRSPPLVAVLGLRGANIGFASPFFPIPPYPPPCGFDIGKGGKGESRLINISGEGGPVCIGGPVAPRVGFPYDRFPSIGETLREGDALTGVISSCEKYGRSNNVSLAGRLRIYNLLAAEVSTLGGIFRPGFKNPGPFVGFCL